MRLKIRSVAFESLIRLKVQKLNINEFSMDQIMFLQRMFANSPGMVLKMMDICPGDMDIFEEASSLMLGESQWPMLVSCEA